MRFETTVFLLQELVWGPENFLNKIINESGFDFVPRFSNTKFDFLHQMQHQVNFILKSIGILNKS